MVVTRTKPALLTKKGYPKHLKPWGSSGFKAWREEEQVTRARLQLIAEKGQFRYENPSDGETSLSDDADSGLEGGLDEGFEDSPAHSSEWSEDGSGAFAGDATATNSDVD